ncbi:protein LONGIFOLIA 1-like [Salvia miltiorrhiza]|uniref:protein LONGIFOLIA 1-like n=1 Tax=Salvia miltiorrhiza TaxID=226208 RepID=UPI0025AB9C03|nr:protein LONGIFOLIA 1-like [Salvia miltiorrhiza]
MSAGMVNEQCFEKHIDKQMGCMTGFLQIFDRHQILSGKRHYPAKRLPPSPVFDTTSESEKSAPASPAISTVTAASPELPMFGMKEGTKCSWKFSKEAPRLSLDSRATTDTKGSLHPKEIRTAASILAAANRCDGNESVDGQQHRSPSVIARLMGLEPLPDSSCFEPEIKPELRRSASESRVSRDLFHSRFISERSNFSSNQPTEAVDVNSPRFSDPINYLLKNAKVDTPKAFNRGSGFHSPSLWNAPRHRKSFFDSGDFFPEPKQAASIYGETENRLKLPGIEEPSKDLETLKQILEALQLKGLLHSRKHSEQHQIRHRTFVYDDSPIVVMKPSRSPNSTPFSRRMANDYSPPLGGNHSRGGCRRNYGLAGENSPSMSPRRDRNVRNPAQSPSPTTTNRAEGNAVGRRSNTLSKPKPLSVETHRRRNGSMENRRLSPVHSPRRTGPERSPRSSKSTAEINRKEKKTEDETSSISGSSITTSTDTERGRSEEYKEGRSLLERCDKLLHSIAEMTATEMQSSPVSVLDSSLYKDECSTPSPSTTRRNIDFKDECVEVDEERWSSETEMVSSQDCDFMYISDIVRASHYLPQEPNVFLLLEKQRYLKGKDTCQVSRLQRKLIFDTVHEILDRNRRLPPWKLASCGQSLEKVWSEFQRVRERERERKEAQDLFDTICGVLKKDLAGDGISGWEDCPLEMSEAILDIERLIFKDLIGEAIRDLAALESTSSNKPTLPSLPRRKLLFLNS